MEILESSGMRLRRDARAYLEVDSELRRHRAMVEWMAPQSRGAPIETLGIPGHERGKLPRCRDAQRGLRVYDENPGRRERRGYHGFQQATSTLCTPLIMHSLDKS